MNVICVWKVHVSKMHAFVERMKEKNLRQDSYATILNVCAGYNYFYETDESFGDVTEFAAERISESHNVPFYTFNL